MAFNEKTFLSTLQAKIADGEAEWIAGIPGNTNPPTLYSVSLGDYRADVVSLDDGFQLWCYDATDRLAEIDVDQKFLDGISVVEAPAEEAMAETVDITARREAMVAAVAEYTKPEPQEESDAGGIEAGTGGLAVADNRPSELSRPAR